MMGKFVTYLKGLKLLRREQNQVHRPKKERLRRVPKKLRQRERDLSTSEAATLGRFDC
jgi:hypothetical protein